MAFQRPTLSELIATAEAEIAANLPGADAALRRTALGVLARTLAGGLHGLYGYLDFIADQVLPDTAAAEYLDRHADIWGIQRKVAAFAAGQVDFTGTDGRAIPAATVLTRADGVRYATVAEVAIAAGVATAAVVAEVPGAAGAAAAGSPLSLITPIAGVAGVATVAAGGLGGAADEEGDAALLARVLDRIQEPPHGGADFDYVAWALGVVGVTRAWVWPLELGLGTVTVRFMMDGAYADGIPLAADVAAVQAALDAVRPVTAAVTVVAPIAVPLDLTIAGLNPATQAVKDAVTAELTDLIGREAAPGGAILISHIREAISIAAGEVDHALTAPIADVAHATGEIAVMGAITWV
ncbi:baseplate J/gp47 family protein [Varunaivibrio sulfuroxidans]|uniref:Putative phage protein gp47/JayE n=1 Tax=Varunaivibrio sulfuroxidans TaxID=1773489 RepID=A0A4R3JBC9_9PROT|nr:baseplate J/gp47 family protein [Varunaivibrio sulfuroxidans]TCS62595.1 putative phage protein gp47/JayE [Varunaivibrio sulfuroxidans]WES30736.1 baseplate J/gp47 family protein [Varunaivibrio sulfuroxidans]